LKGKDYSNHFMTVCNSAKQVKPFVDKIDWMEVHHVASCPKKNAGRKSIEKKQQDSYEDPGSCSSINQTQEGASDGIAGPRLKLEMTLNLEVVNGYIVLSEFFPPSAPSGPAATKFSILIHWNQTDRKNSHRGSRRTTCLNACN
jgi:hypothetical protein